jgi:type IV pilus assembly protein PilY1
MKPESSLMHRLRFGVCTLVASLMPLQAQANAADIAGFPLGKSSSVAVRANLMFVMDDSGSMGAAYLPDDAVRDGYCWGDYTINKIHYNPAVVYVPPLDATGASMPNASFTGAWIDGFNQNFGVINLSDVYALATPTVKSTTSADGDTTLTHYYYAKSRNTPPDCGPNTYSGNLGRYTYVATESENSWFNNARASWEIVTTLPFNQRQNYANWYSYYRTRMNVMKSSVGRAMLAIDASRFRIGYSSIRSGELDTSDLFLPVNDFNATQKTEFFNRLYGAYNSSYTSLRPALEKIGRYYAKKPLGGHAWPSSLPDPMQYSCQRNYTILTTDGYWNKETESYVARTSTPYTPLKLDGSNLGNVDGPNQTPGVSRPLLDDGQTVGNNWITGGAGVGNSLADIAQYFYATDLRDGTPNTGPCTGSIAGQTVCDNSVSPSGADTATHQHMVTFALGLGVAGRLTYSSDYETALTGSFADVKAGTLAWPDPQTDDPRGDYSPVVRADDLWHAAVNGRGRFYSASNPSEVVNGLTDAMDLIASIAGVAAAAATSSLQPVAGDNFIFIGEYTTVLWEGNLRAHTLDTDTGALGAQLWSAKTALASQAGATSDSRNVFFRNPSTGVKEDFNAIALDSAGLVTHFSDMCPTTNSKLSQCATLSPDQKAVANTPANVVKYIRGQSAFDNSIANTTPSNRVFRSRVNTWLGDVVNASPAYVKAPPFKYADAGYQAFKNTNASRQGVVYLAANDGMLHALNASTGSELWAFVPTMVMPLMYRRADEGYASKHVYMTDGTPVVGDVFDGTNWRTILVGGLNAGGRGYYALDVTDPTNPVILWELTNAEIPNLGLSFGNPVIAKDKDGKWFVAFTSGYNNVTGSANGNGHVYIRDAVTGASIRTIETHLTPGSNNTPAGTTGSPSNLGKLGVYVEGDTDNTAQRLYAGDMKGNLWRVDYDDTVSSVPGRDATLMAQLRGPSGAVQPITTVPMLSTVGSNASPLVTVGTGRYLGVSDLTDVSVQSLYFLKDGLGAVAHTNMRADTTSFQKKTWIESTVSVNNVSKQVRRLDANAVDWNVLKGWYADFSLTAGERLNVDMAQASGFIGVATNIPAPTACNPGGRSWLYVIDFERAVAADSQEIQALAAGVNMVVLPSGTRFMEIDYNGDVSLSATVQSPNAVRLSSRSSWRELIQGR